MSMTLRLTFIVALLLLTIGAAPSFAQPEEGPGREPDRSMMRERLEGELERLRAREAWVLRRLETIEQGQEVESDEPDRRGNRRDAFREGGPDRWSRQNGDQALSPEAMREVIEDLREAADIQGDGMFMRFLERDTEESRRFLSRMEPRLRELHDLKRRDRALYGTKLRELGAGLEIGRAARHLGELIRTGEADEEALQSARDALRHAIAQGFDAKAAATKQELAGVQAKLNELTEEIARAESEREAQIEARYQEMLRRMESHMNSPREDRRPPRDRSGND